MNARQSPVGSPDRLWMLVLRRFAIAYAIALAIFFAVPSSLLVFDKQHPYVGPTGINAFPLLLILLLLALFLFIYRSDLKSIPRWAWRPSVTQIMFAFLALAAVSVFAHWITHPPMARYHVMSQFMSRFPYGGDAFLAFTFFLCLLLPLVPALFLVFPMMFFRRFAEPLLFGGAILVIFIYSHVIEIAYHLFTTPVVTRVIYSLLSLLSAQTTIVPEQSRLSLSGFSVVLGPACTDLSSIVLFLCLFGFVCFRLLRRDALKGSHALIAALGGIVLLWSLNIVRITSIMLIGVKFPDFALSLFHSSVGGVLFFLFFLLYIKLIVPLVRRT
ncbi:TPA: hypothetical protein DCL30_02985 [Candidatus Peribacteria bacterium]|nr:MAG: hypothetical protein A3J91_00235 [Candidatus Peribacteria bacterium RIFOXYC2_FULL_58_10]OGJ83815.1 MAG: hypothetical protein A2529_05725 [Candidatus Peribacteria bacterium RIFOXYD2_FULL_58_15]HAI98485.1 hypothetical protein [Candidatus Peribacteria bacterium]HAS34197.1 hypothetical protein [Candidatus Peribacteria bacterium]